MSASHEWTEWHLTPRGWEPGKSSLDSQPVKGPDSPPTDRVLSIKYDEYVGSAYSKKIDKSFKEVYRSSNHDLVQSLIKQFGDCPEKIYV